MPAPHPATSLPDTSPTVSSGPRDSMLGPSERQLQIINSTESEVHVKTAQLIGSNYTRIVVIPRTRSDDTAWLEEQLPDADTAIYTVDDLTAQLHPPKNKGHEVMVYLTYIIDHYHELPDVIIFMHAHRLSWHNNELLDFDAAEMIRRLNDERVVREGYMNMRCHWDPGCPVWLQPYVPGEIPDKQEQNLLATCWNEIFPLDRLPHLLSQPCCAQFAVSRERILSIPLERFVFYRDWLLRTALTDYISGRIWEFVWHYVFTGRNTYCPAEHACYCDGFGVCFGGETQYKEFFNLNRQKKSFEIELEEIQKVKTIGKDALAEGFMGSIGSVTSDLPELGRDTYLNDRIQALNIELKSRILDALERGKHPGNRAFESIIERSHRP
ncbi:hypothetical protein MMC24_002482 [Lignoscripta atroalba]|nr:hypothetical protein [Lignoscripta atroalba]